MVAATAAHGYESVDDARRWALAGLNVIDVESGSVAPNRVIVVKDGFIENVVANSSFDPDSVELVVDLDGLYAIPGLWDMHIHLRGGPELIDANERWLRQYLAFGIISGLGSAGQVFVYERSGGTFTQTATLSPNDLAPFDNFGISVALAGDTALIGSGGDDDAGNGSGSAYVFVRNGGVWSQQAKLVADDAEAFDLFGSAVTLNGNTALIGATEFFGARPGSAYVFTRSGTTWTQQAKLVPAIAVAGDLFGVSVALEGDTAVVGSNGNNGGGTQSGAAYVFTRSGTTWTEQQQLAPADAAENQQFGGSIAIEGDTLLIGAAGDDDVAVDSGAVYLFTRSGGTWSEAAKLKASDAETLDSFGQPAANCPTVANADQLDANGDGYGDACVSVTGFISRNVSVGPGLILGMQSRIIGSVRAGENLNVGSFSWVIGPNQIGDNVVIGPRVTIGAGAIIGNNVILGPDATVAPGAVVPDGTRLRARQSFP